jgi:hypothetical protein
VINYHLACDFIENGVRWLVLDQTHTLQFGILVVQVDEVCLDLPHIGQSHYWKHIACIHYRVVALAHIEIVMVYLCVDDGQD